MTRRIVYGISLWVFLGAAACTIAAIALPAWITYTSPSSTDPVRISYGLHKRCSSLTGECKPFPTEDVCHGFKDRYFCSMWRSTAFFMNFVVVAELACVIAYATILVGGRAAREAGWKMLAGLLAVVAAGELIAMALVAYLYNNDNRFFDGWQLDKAFVLCTVSWVVMLIDAVGIVGAGLFLQKDDDYEPIPEPN